jgi:hypothetical protein
MLFHPILMEATARQHALKGSPGVGLVGPFKSFTFTLGKKPLKTGPVKLYTRRLTGDFLVNEFIMRTQWKP